MPRRLRRPRSSGPTRSPRTAPPAEVFHRDATLSSRSVSALLRAPADDAVQLKLAWMFR
jgi:hypothetical protein